MLVRCKHYSASGYPDGGHREGDIFDLPKKQAEYFKDIGWVDILPDKLQPLNKKGKKKLSKSAVDLSKSPQKGRFLQHTFR